MDTVSPLEFKCSKGDRCEQITSHIYNYNLKHLLQRKCVWCWESMELRPPDLHNNVTLTLGPEDDE